MDEDRSGSESDVGTGASVVAFRVLGWPPEGPRLRLDHRTFAYAGKFVLPTGKALAVVPGDLSLPDPREGAAKGVLGAAAFDADRTDSGVLVVRYVTVRTDRRGEGLGARLLAFVAARAATPGTDRDSAADDAGYARVRIAVNNPFAYEAAAKAGFAFVGRETGIAELVCERRAGGPPERVTPDAYRDGLHRFGDRDLTADERAFVRQTSERGPPDTVAVP